MRRISRFVNQAMISLKPAFWAALLAVSLTGRPAPAQEWTGDTIQTSPDGRYRLDLAQTREAVIVYRWVQKRPLKVLVEIPSSYQWESDDSAYQDARSIMGACWSADGRFLAIEEFILRWKGTVLAALRVAPDEARQIVVPEKEMLRQVGGTWKHFRLHLEPGRRWDRSGNLRLGISGQVHDLARGPAEYWAAPSKTAILRDAYGSVLIQPGRLLRAAKEMPESVKADTWGKPVTSYWIRRIRVQRGKATGFSSICPLERNSVFGAITQSFTAAWP